ncbi:MAG: FAD-binding protein [Nevskia sp.]|nr:FAD-binding protein [Nevskia sp.]
MNKASAVDVLVIGAGPAGALAAAFARRQGLSVRVLEKIEFPRFSIGESLLPACMNLLAEAGMVDAVEAAGFQYKNGAQIARGDRFVDFVFADKTAEGYSHTYEVTRADFDHLLIRQAEAQGAQVQFREEIISVDFADTPRVVSRNAAGVETEHQARFVLDASGFGRTLPRLLDLEMPSNFPVRAALFTHVDDHISDPHYDRNKIRVGIHPQHRDVWYWLIPFSQGRASVGVVAGDEFLRLGGADADQRLWAMINEEPGMKRLLGDARQLFPAREIRGYAAKVKSLHGKGYALLGNAGEFLDPVFSSGVTIAMKSAQLAVRLVARQLGGEDNVAQEVDWEVEYAKPLMLGVETFRGYVETWYEGALQDVMFSSIQPPKLRAMMCSVLAGYAWDKDNPYVGHSGRRLRSLAQVVRANGTATAL